MAAASNGRVDEGRSVNSEEGMIDDIDIEKLKAAFQNAAKNAEPNLLWEGENVLFHDHFDDGTREPPPADDGAYDDGVDDGDDPGGL